jgi:hypothetical protein
MPIDIFLIFCHDILAMILFRILAKSKEVHVLVSQTSHLGQVVHFYFWRTTSRQTHQIMLVYTTDNFFKRLGPYITYFPVALPFHQIQGKRRNIDVSLFSPLHLFVILGSTGINGRNL